jgi:twinkle protein
MADLERAMEWADSIVTPSLVEPGSLRGELHALWNAGMPSGALTGWPSVDRHYTVAEGMVTVLTGWPGSGKSEWLDALLINLARQGWHTAIFSPENQPLNLHASKLLEKVVGKPFGRGPTERIAQLEIDAALDQIDGWFRFIAAPEGGGLSAKAVLETAEAWLKSHPGKRGLVIDPWNELEHWRPHGLSETEYISQTLSHVRNWARSRRVHVWLVAHPQKVARENGKLPIPRPDMISGSQHWWNKADMAVTIYRDMEQPDRQEIDVYVMKVRFKHLGRPGCVQLRYDRVTGRYHEIPSLRDVNRYRNKGEDE